MDYIQRYMKAKPYPGTSLDAAHLAVRIAGFDITFSQTTLSVCCEGCWFKLDLGATYSLSSIYSVDIFTANTPANNNCYQVSHLHCLLLDSLGQSMHLKQFACWHCWTVLS